MGHGVGRRLESQLEEPVRLVLRRRRIQDDDLPGPVGDGLEGRDRIGQVVEDPFEQADVEALGADLLVDLAEIAEGKSDPVPVGGQVLLEKLRLLDPVIPDVEAKRVLGAQIVGHHAVPAAVAGHVEEPLSAEPPGIDGLQQGTDLVGVDDPHGEPRSVRGLDVALAGPHARGDLDVDVPRGQRPDLGLEAAVHNDPPVP
jgi:hypothetical protein